jgi:[protein-PII] uridylyltransferase
MRNLRRLTMDEYAHEFPFESRLINAFPRHWLLYVAALFHDIAKGRGGDHSLLGMADARAFCVAHELADEDAELVVWLVGEHLTMSQTAQKEDISDPEVVRSFAARVGDERRLTALYLFTVADVRGTSPKVWNAWKAQLLEGLYNTTLRHLQTGQAPEVHGVIAERQREAMRLLRYFALSDTVHERLWKQFDTVYFLRHTAEEIAWHTRALHYRIFNDQPVVKARLYRGEHELGTPSPGSLQVMVYTHDQRDLFVRMAGFFARAGFSVVDAKIHTTRHGYALDSFVLVDVQERDHDREMISFIEHELGERLLNQVPVDTPAPGRMSRQVRHFPYPPQVEIRPDEKGKHFIVSIVAADRPGLLYQIATAFGRHGVSIDTAKIATLGERVEDTFLIAGGDLAVAAKRLQLETELHQLLKV